MRRTTIFVVGILLLWGAYLFIGIAALVTGRVPFKTPNRFSPSRVRLCALLLLASLPASLGLSIALSGVAPSGAGPIDSKAVEIIEEIEFLKAQRKVGKDDDVLLQTLHDLELKYEMARYDAKHARQLAQFFWLPFLHLWTLLGAGFLVGKVLNWGRVP